MTPERLSWARGPAGRRSSELVLAISLALSILAGAAVSQGRVEIALVVAGGLFGLAAFRHLSVSGWCLLLLLTTVGMRIFVTTLGLPQSLNFLHYPVAAGFAIAALQRPARPASRAPSIWLIAFVLLSVSSMVVNLSHPVRWVLFLVITGESLLIVWALSRWEISDRDRLNIGLIVLVFALVQLPIGMLQAASAGLGDAVQGTLAGHGAGSHVLGGLFALGLLVIAAAIVARRVGWALGLVGAAVCIGMMLATGSIAVTVLSAISVMLVPSLTTSHIARRRRLPPRRATGILAGVALGIAGLFLAQIAVSNVFERAQRLVTEEEFPEVEMISERADNPGLLLVGSGPGTSASRASLLVIGAEEKGPPLSFFGLKPTEQALEIAATTRQEGGGTAESARSSALAIIGDLGILGFVGLIVLFVRIWRETSMSDDWLAPAVRGALILITALIFVDSWLEYPEFVVPLAILFGLVLSGRSDRSMKRELTSWSRDHRRSPSAIRPIGKGAEAS